jgi:hypothetical protein
VLIRRYIFEYVLNQFVTHMSSGNLAQPSPQWSSCRKSFKLLNLMWRNFKSLFEIRVRNKQTIEETMWCTHWWQPSCAWWTHTIHDGSDFTSCGSLRFRWTKYTSQQSSFQVQLMREITSDSIIHYLSSTILSFRPGQQGHLHVTREGWTLTANSQVDPGVGDWKAAAGRRCRMWVWG